MNETSLTFLRRLRESPETEHWDRLVELYAPLIKTWLQKYHVQSSDADDLMQEVLLAVSKELGNFEHRGKVGAFRAWLKSILVNRLRKFWRTRDRRPQTFGGADIEHKLAKLEDPASELSQLWNREHDQNVLRQLLILAEPRFAPNTWAAFCRVTLDGEALDDVAADLGISRNAVVISKCRVIKTLRQESEGLVETSAFNSAGS